MPADRTPKPPVPIPHYRARAAHPARKTDNKRTGYKAPINPATIKPVRGRPPNKAYDAVNMTPGGPVTALAQQDRMMGDEYGDSNKYEDYKEEEEDSSPVTGPSNSWGRDPSPTPNLESPASNDSLVAPVSPALSTSAITISEGESIVVDGNRQPELTEDELLALLIDHARDREEREANGSAVFSHNEPVHHDIMAGARMDYGGHAELNEGTSTAPPADELMAPSHSRSITPSPQPAPEPYNLPSWVQDLTAEEDAMFAEMVNLDECGDDLLDN